jgi:leader peptidase (prepilin peptidase)/N-methyltransferase
MAADCSNKAEARTGSVTVGEAGAGWLSGETSMLVQFNPQRARRCENGAEWFDAGALFEPGRATSLAQLRADVYSSSRMIRILGTIFAGMLGLAFGSFLNVCLSRWPEGESVVQPRSHCRQCGHALAWWENVPLVSWLALRGECRNCRAEIGWRYPLVELAVGALWAAVAWQSYGALFPLEFAAGMMIFMWMLVALATLDAEYFWLPNAITLPGIALGFLWWLLQSERARWATHVSGEVFQALTQSGERLLSIAGAAAAILLIRWVYWLLRRREGIGLGDAKLMALMAAWLGLPGALLALAIGAILGSVAALAMLALPGLRRGSASWAATMLPLGTFLCIGGIVSSLWGHAMIEAYLHWAGI